jgi:hypothetical protein
MLYWFTALAVSVVFGRPGVVLTECEAGVASSHLCACSEGEGCRTRFGVLKQAGVCDPRHQPKHPREQRDTGGVSELPAGEVHEPHQSSGLTRQESRAGVTGAWRGFTESLGVSMAPTTSSRSVNRKPTSAMALLTCGSPRRSRPRGRPQRPAEQIPSSRRSRPSSQRHPCHRSSWFRPAQRPGRSVPRVGSSNPGQQVLHGNSS